MYFLRQGKISGYTKVNIFIMLFNFKVVFLHTMNLDGNAGVISHAIEKTGRHEENVNFRINCFNDGNMFVYSQADFIHFFCRIMCLRMRKKIFCYRGQTESKGRMDRQM